MEGVRAHNQMKASGAGAWVLGRGDIVLERVPAELEAAPRRMEREAKDALRLFL